MRIQAAKHEAIAPYLPLLIRRATRADIPAMQMLIRRSFLVNYGQFAPWPMIQHWVNTDVGGQLIEQEWETFTVAAIAHQVVGLLQLRSNWVQELWIDPHYQRHGIGTALLNHAEAVTVETGFLPLKTTVFAENLDALRFYLAHNWEPLGIPEPVEVAPGVVLHQQKFISITI